MVVGAASDMLRGTTSRADHKQAWCQQTFNSKLFRRAHTRERHQPDARRRVSRKRPPARPACGGPRKTLLSCSDVRQNAKHTARPRDRHYVSSRARGGVGGGWRGV